MRNVDGIGASSGAERGLDTSLDEILPQVQELLEEFLGNIENAPADGRRAVDVEPLRAPPGSAPAPLTELLRIVRSAAELAVETAGPRYFGFIPGGGLPSSAVGELVSRILNRYTGLSDLAPGLVALEDGVLRWLASVFRLPAGANGLLTTGGSQAALTAVVSARERHLAGGDLSRARIYLSEQAHRSMSKAARIAGLPRSAVRVIPTVDGRRIDPGAVRTAVEQDRRAGLVPFLLVGTAGTTNAGAVDPLEELSRIASEQRIWFHVDACYGGFFQLTDRGRRCLTGIERADSISLDPHKSLFLPYGTGALLVRDPAALTAAFDDDGGTYLQDLADTALPDYAHLGSELTREHRGLRIWLPLHLHGVDAFRSALDEKLDLARHAHRRLAELPGLDMVEPPELSTTVFRVIGGDAANREALKRINASGRVFCSSTELDGKLTLRLCVLSHRTHRAHLDEALEIIAAAIAG
ncbi:aminotransferase class V-fold PLP-dependent enzyme [Actinomycetes bacterium KLBMP 9759]